MSRNRGRAIGPPSPSLSPNSGLGAQWEVPPGQPHDWIVANPVARPRPRGGRMQSSARCAVSAQRTSSTLIVESSLGDRKREPGAYARAMTPGDC